MDIKAGDMVLGRWRVMGPLPAQGELHRFSAEDRATGEGVEVVSPSRSAALRPGAAERLRAAAQPGDSSVLLPVLADGALQGRPILVRAPISSGWPAGERLDPQQLRLALSWLVPAALQASPALGGELDAQDLVIDTDGVVRLAPSGQVREVSLSRLPRHRPPELGPGEPGGPAAVLYGLGVLLFEAATGQPPFQARSLGDLGEAQRRPLPARQIDPGLPEDLAEILDALVSPEPGQRLEAAARLPPAVEPLRLEVAESALPSPPLASPARPVIRASSAVRDLPMGAWVVLFDPKDATLGARRRLAALLGVPVEVLEGAEALPVAMGESEDEARREREALALSGAALRVERRVPAARGILGLLAGLLLLAALPLFVVGLPILGLLLVLLAAIPGGLALRAGGARTRSWSRSWGALQAAMELPPEPGPRAALQDARRSLLQRDLPDAVRVDLLQSVDDLDEQLDSLGPEPDPAVLATITRAAEALSQAARAGVESGSAAEVSQAAELAARNAARALRQG